MSHGQYRIDLEDPSDITIIIEDMIEEGKESSNARVAELEQELEEANEEISSLNDRIAELRAGITDRRIIK